MTVATAVAAPAVGRHIVDDLCKGLESVAKGDLNLPGVDFKGRLAESRMPDLSMSLP